MKAKDLIFNHRSQWKQIKELCKVFPNICVSILSLAFIIESIDLSNLPTFVVSSQNGNSIFVPYFEGDEECYSLNWVIPSIDIIAHKQIVSIWAIASYFEELNQVMKLPMNVSTDCDWAPHRLHIDFLWEDFLRSFNQIFHFILA